MCLLSSKRYSKYQKIVKFIEESFQSLCFCQLKIGLGCFFSSQLLWSAYQNVKLFPYPFMGSQFERKITKQNHYRPINLENNRWKKWRSRQDSNLRSQRESDFESDALTTRPRLLYLNCELWFYFPNAIKGN